MRFSGQSSRLRHRRVLGLACGLLVSGAACAQHSPALDRASLWLGGYYASTDTTLGANMRNGTLGGDVNLEDDLGFDDRATSPRARLNVLVGDSQGFSFDYYRYHRSSSKSLSDNVTFRGTTYVANARASGELNFDFGSAAYRWWFGSGNDAFGLGLGAGYYRVKASVSGQASVNDESVQASTSTGAHAWAPLLQLGWRHAFNDHWRMYLDASGVKKNGGDLNGHIYNAALGVQWFPWRNLGLSAEYDVNRIRLHQSHSRYDDDLDLRLNGPSLFVTFRF